MTSSDRKLEMLHKDKNAVIYGAGGGVGGAMARAFARDKAGGKARLTVRRVSAADAAELARLW